MTDTPLATILSVDDDDFVRESMVRYLEMCDYKVLEANDGLIGLEVFRSKKPDLILLDLRMPELDGLDVLATVRKESPDTPVIIVSGAGGMGDAVKAIHLGAWDYLIKPITELSLLLHSVEKCLERSHLIRENRAYQKHLEDMVRTRTAQLQEANEELAETRLQIIRRLGKTAEYKDNETGKHVIRVSLYSEILAKTLGLDDETVDLIYSASPMHDIGKVGVPDNILNKPDCLNTDEWTIMREHCPKGADILNPLKGEELSLYHRHAAIGQDILNERKTPLLRVAAEIAGGHHERWDGSGYPNGLKGNMIPLEARIVAVADVYDALASRRSYKAPLPHEECERIIRAASGTQFDPEVVEAFIQSIDSFLAVREEWTD